MNLNLENLFGVMVITSLIILIWALLFALFWCECGTIVTTQFAMFDHELWQCKWYLFPKEMQQMLSFVISNTQDPVTLLSYGNIECTRDTFKRVIAALFFYSLFL